MLTKKRLFLTALILFGAITISIGWVRNKVISAFSNSYSKEQTLSKSNSKEPLRLQKEDLMAESEKVRKRIFELRRTKDLKTLVALADEVEATWAQRDIIFYTGLMIDICGALSSADFDDDTQYLFLRKYVKQALEKSDQMLIEQEVLLVEFTQGDIEYVLNLVKAENWPADRTERTKLWCHAWQKLEKEIDKNYDVSKEYRPNYNLSPEKRREENERNFTQRKLRRIYNTFSRAFELYATFVYSKKPANTSELRYYLESCFQDVQLRERILTKVENNISNAQ